MIPLPRCLWAGLAVALVAAAASASEPIKFARTPALSPDGKTVAFSYLGDLWTVEAAGGVARPITMHDAHDINPAFSPDGQQIAFSSNRHGQYDVFVVAAVGGKPRRLTFDSGQDMVSGWTPDGQHVVFSSTRSPAYPSGSESYIVPVAGGAERKLNLFEAKESHVSPAGNTVAFVRGPGLWYRRGYRGSSNDDIWLASEDGATQKPLTKFDGQDTMPMWSRDGKTLYYVSENGSPIGCANVVSQDIADFAPAGPPKRITTHTHDTVRHARISGNGEWIVYECGTDLWLTGTKSGATPRKLAIEVNADDKANTERVVTFTRDVTEYTLAPDEDYAVVGVQGELFLTKLPEGGKAVRLTESPAYDYGASFSPNGKSIAFLSDRSGVQELYLLEADDPDHPELTKAHRFKTKKLTDTREEESAARFSPKGDRIAFLRSGKLWTIKPDGTDARVLVDRQQVADYDWSPDGAHIVFARVDGSFASEIYIVPVDGRSAPRNVTRYATFNTDVTWSATGGKIGFIGQRGGKYYPHVLSLQRPAAPGTKPSPAGTIDWDDLHLRADRAAPIEAETMAVSPNGQQIAFRHRSQTSGDDLWMATGSGVQVSRITTGSQRPTFIQWSRRSTGRVYFLNGLGELRYVFVPPPGYPASTSAASSEPSKVNFSAKMTIRQNEEFEEMFAQSWRALSDRFYDPAYHGANWQAVRAKYQPVVAHVGKKEDLYALVSLMLGELNASHLGISGKLPTPDENTAELGLIFDESYRGPGLKVAEILKRGPADRRGLNLKPGDVILAIDRVELTSKVNVPQLLNSKAGEGVSLDVSSDPDDPKARRRVELIATTRTDSSARPLGSVERRDAQELHYERWVARNAAAVEKATNGRIGYIHIPSMDEAGLELFVRALYSDNFDKDGIIVDVRYNGGGFTHDQVLNYLGGKDHTIFRQRDGGEGLVLRNFDRKWNKPVVVMCNNRSYSDAEIFPHAFKTLGYGKVVGQPTGGYVIGTTSVRLIDGSQFRVPRTGVFTVGGANMDKQGVVPDVVVDVTVADWAKGTDTQLAKAVDVLAADVAAWKKSKSAIGIPMNPPPKANPGGQ